MSHRYRYFGTLHSKRKAFIIIYWFLIIFCLFTGATPKNIPVFERVDDAVKDKIITFRTKEDFLELEYNVNKPDVKNIVIVGGGFLGSELACSMARNRAYILKLLKKKINNRRIIVK